MKDLVEVTNGYVGSPLAVAYLIYKSFPEMTTLSDDEKSTFFGAILRYLKLRLGLTIWTESAIASHFTTIMEAERDKDARDFYEKLLNKYHNENPERSKIITAVLQEFREKFLSNKENPNSIQEQLIKQAINKAMRNKDAKQP